MAARRRSARRLALWLVVAASLCFALGLFVPVVELEKLGSEDRSYSVLGGLLDLARGGNVLLALLVLSFSVLFPIAKLGLLARLLATRVERAERRGLLRWLALLGKWSMLDVFVVAILIGAVQLGILAGAAPRAGIHLFGAGIVLAMLSTAAVASALGERAPAPAPRELARSSLGERLLPLVGLALLVAGLALPLLQVEKWLFWKNEYSVLQALLELARGGDPLLAAVVALFVVLLPVARFLGVAWLRWRREAATPWAARLARLEEWAMLEVYVLALLVVLVKISDLASVEPRAGLWLCFAAALVSALDSWLLRRARRL